MRTRVTPQEKKIRSYQHDGRNTYGENDKSSRKNIPRSKALSERSYRSQVRSLLRLADGDVDVRVREVRRWSFSKTPDTPLAEVVPEESKLRAEALRRRRSSGRL